jgi:hypothetical protein
LFAALADGGDAEDGGSAAEQEGVDDEAPAAKKKGDKKKSKKDVASLFAALEVGGAQSWLVCARVWLCVRVWELSQFNSFGSPFVHEGWECVRVRVCVCVCVHACVLRVLVHVP